MSMTLSEQVEQMEAELETVRRVRDMLVHNVANFMCDYTRGERALPKNKAAALAPLTQALNFAQVLEKELDTFLTPREAVTVNTLMNNVAVPQRKQP